MSRMPKCLSLFGRYIRRNAKAHQWTFRKYQVTKVIPNSAAGRVPSAASQMNLWHSDDFNAYWKVSAFNTIFRKRTSPFSMPKSFHSEMLGSHPIKVRVTPSAMYAMDDKGGFGEYITRTPPEELRSAAGEKMRSVITYLQENPRAKALGLPWNVFTRKRDRSDPVYVKYRAGLRKACVDRRLGTRHSKFSPYYLPKSDGELFPQRDSFVGKSNPGELNLWWKNDGNLEKAFRKRISAAKSYEEAHPDRHDPSGYRKGEGAGGGGGQGSPRPRSKTHRSRKTRPY